MQKNNLLMFFLFTAWK